MKNALRGVVILAAWATASPAQFPRLAPPPACRADGPAPSYLTYWNAAASRDSRPKLVVFALEPEVDDINRVYLANALPERIRQRLSADSRIHVATEAAVTRALTVARARHDSAARVLDADYMLTGTLLVAGERQEVHVVLSRPGQTAPVWRASFRATTSLRSIEEAVVRGLARVLRVSAPAPIEKGWPRSAAAYEALLTGDAFMRSPVATGLDSALFHYERAATLEPTSSVAAERLARAAVVILENGDEVPGHAGGAGAIRVNELLSRAFAADSSSEAWTTRAMLSRVTDPVRFNGALAAHARAVRADANDADAEHEYGVTLLRLGDRRAAEVHFRRALALSPSRPSTLALLAGMELQASRWDNACAVSNASIAAWPYAAEPYATRAEARLRLSEARDAFSDAEMVRRLATGAWVEALRILILKGTSNVDNARGQITALTANWLSPGKELPVRDAEYMALAYMAMDDRRRAVESLKRARPVGTDLRVVLGDPRLAALRADTAVARLLVEAEGRDLR